MTTRPFIYIALTSLLVLMLATSCNKQSYQKVLKSTDFKFKYEKAIEYYDKGKYTKAIPLLEELRTYVGNQDIEKISYLYAQAHFKNMDYITAAYYFKTFTDFYPKSVYVEEAAFMIGYCYYKLSPRTALEQTYTLKSIDAFQLFINAHPYSEKVAEANGLIDDMRDKLEDKAFESAFLYYKIKSYKAAITSYGNLLKEFPDTDRKEEINFMVLKSSFELAQKSIETKKEERFNTTIESYYAFIDKYPKSKFARDAERIYDVSSRILTKYKSNE